MDRCAGLDARQSSCGGLGDVPADLRGRSRVDTPERDGTVRFRILGPVEVWTGQAWAGIGAPKWRSLLAALLINPGQVVPTDRLIMELRGDAPPAGATNLVSIYALRLRRLIGDDSGEVLRTRAPGYQVSLGPEDLDASRFDLLVGAGRQALARQEPQRAADLLARALDLWRGDALVDVPPSELVTAEAERLGQARLDAHELRIKAEIGCGRHAQVIAELFRLIAAHPLGRDCGACSCRPWTGPVGTRRRWPRTRGPRT
jgi:DNA-binding SARP family transcriptional activator